MGRNYQNLFKTHDRHGIADRFAGRFLGEFTVVDLRKLIKHFDPNAHFPNGEIKLDLCKRLYGLSSWRLTKHKNDANTAINPRKISTVQRLFLKDENSDLDAAEAKFKLGRRPVKRKCDHETADNTESKRQRLDETEQFEPAKKDVYGSTEPSPQLECSIYADDQKTPLDFQPIPVGAQCKHPDSICNECFTHWLDMEAKLDTFQKVHRQFTCPAEGCKCPLTHTQMCNHASPKVFEAYDSCIVQSLLEEDDESGFFACPNPECDAGGFAEKSTTTFNCIECGTQICIDCKETWHPDLTREEFRADRERRKHMESTDTTAQQEAQSGREVNAISRPCPRCNVPINKISGCDHMTCKDDSPHIGRRLNADDTRWYSMPAPVLPVALGRPSTRYERWQPQTQTWLSTLLRTSMRLTAPLIVRSFISQLLPA